MAIQDDNTILNKGDLKAYHEAIAPMLGGTLLSRTNVSDHYSTDEKMVGVWIDGKPLYQKSFSVNSPADAGSETAIAAFSLSVDKIVSLDIILQSGNEFIPAGWQYGSGSYAATNVYARATRTTLSMSVGISAYTSKPVFATIQYTKTTDAAGSATATPGAYDINFPNTWKENTEVYFGNGVYGQRFTGTITAAANTRELTILSSTMTNIKIINQGGYLKNDAASELAIPGSYSGGNNVFLWAATIAITQDTGLFINSIFDIARTNAPYDVWITYSK